MPKNSAFWLCIVASVIGVFTLGIFSVNHTLRKYQQGSILEGVPVDFFKDGVKEFQAETASSVEMLREVLKRGMVSEMPNSSSSE